MKQTAIIDAGGSQDLRPGEDEASDPAEEGIAGVTEGDERLRVTLSVDVPLLGRRQAVVALSIPRES